MTDDKAGQAESRPSCCGSSTATVPASTSAPPLSDDALRRAVRDRYATAARQALAGGPGAGGPASDSACCGDGPDPISSDLYSEEEATQVPQGAAAASLGCGNPTALAALREGEIVLDLGSGGGLDVLLSARRVGPDGFAYGLDMTPEMLELAEQHQRQSGLTNVRFLHGSIEAIPLPDASVDVVISNCVINLSVDKPAVFREVARVLRPGGRVAVSDIVLRRPLPAADLASLDAWTGCVAGAIPEQDYRRELAAAGLEDVEVEVTRELGGDVVSAFIRGRKPLARTVPAAA